MQLVRGKSLTKNGKPWGPGNEEKEIEKWKRNQGKVRLAKNRRLTSEVEG